MGLAIDIGVADSGALIVVLSGSANRRSLEGLKPALATALAYGSNVVVDATGLELADGSAAEEYSAASARISVACGWWSEPPTHDTGSA